jgi:hypothetical protein
MLVVEGLTRGLAGGRQNRRLRHLGGTRVGDRPSGWEEEPVPPRHRERPLRFDGVRLRGLRHTGHVAVFMERLFWQSWLSRYLNARKDVLRAHRPRTRSGVLDHLQQPARNTIDLPVLVKVDGRRAG